MKVGEVGSVLAMGTCSITQQGGGTLGDIVTVWAPAVAPSQLCTVGEALPEPRCPEMSPFPSPPQSVHPVGSSSAPFRGSRRLPEDLTAPAEPHWPSPWSLPALSHAPAQLFPWHWSSAQNPPPTPSALCLSWAASWAGSGGQALCGGPWHGSSCLRGLVYEGWESIGIAEPFSVPSGHRRGRGGAGQIMTLPSLLTSSSPCNVLDSFLIKAQCLTINRSEGSAFQHGLTGSCRNCPRLVGTRAALEKENQVMPPLCSPCQLLLHHQGCGRSVGGVGAGGQQETCQAP